MSLTPRSPELDMVNTTNNNKFEKHNALILGPAVCSWVCHSSPKRKTPALLFVYQCFCEPQPPGDVPGVGAGHPALQWERALESANPQR